jgi:SPP1 gp7 family putative phage head morphogenesis protein
MRSNAETEQARRIRLAIEEAVKHRDRYAEAHVADLTKTLKAASDDVAKQIRRFEERAALKPWQEMRLVILKDLESEIDAIAKELEAEWKVGIRANVEGSMKLGIEDGIGQLEALEHPDFQNLSDLQRKSLLTRTFSTIDRAAVDFLANYELQLLGDVSTELASGIKRTITQGVLEGKSIPQVAREIGKVVDDPDAFLKAGKTVFKSTQQRATLIARTETLRAHNEGRKVFYREVGVKKVKWITAHDERTCPECAPLDGRVFKIDDAPGPPRHPGCRCATTAYIG